MTEMDAACQISINKIALSMSGATATISGITDTKWEDVDEWRDVQNGEKSLNDINWQPAFRVTNKPIDNQSNLTLESQSIRCRQQFESQVHTNPVCSRHEPFDRLFISFSIRMNFRSSQSIAVIHNPYDDLVHNHYWYIKQCHQETYEDGDDGTIVTVSIHLKRKLMPYFLNIIGPSFCLSFIGLLCHVMDDGDQLNALITLLLATICIQWVFSSYGSGASYVEMIIFCNFGYLVLLFVLTVIDIVEQPEFDVLIIKALSFVVATLLFVVYGCHIAHPQSEPSYSSNVNVKMNSDID
eukprot:31335_1